MLSTSTSAKSNLVVSTAASSVQPPAAALIQFYIGLGLAMASSVFIGSSFILKKKALMRLAAKDTSRRAASGGYGYLKDWMWWSGVITMGAGEACNFAAYAFASATLVSCLGALSVLVTSVLSSRLLGENLNLLAKMGCAICILGSTVIVIHSPKEESVTSMAELGDKMKEIGFVVYVLCVLALSMAMIVWVAPRYGQTNILVYIMICSIIGSLSVLGCKGLGLAFKETFNGSNQLSNWLTWFWLLSVVVCVTAQLNYLNRALDIFNANVVTPIYYVLFTSFVILASGVLYSEWLGMRAEDVLGNFAGFIVTIIGIFQMQLFRDVNISTTQLRQQLRRRPGSSAVFEEDATSGSKQPFAEEFNCGSSTVQYEPLLNGGSDLCGRSSPLAAEPTKPGAFRDSSSSSCEELFSSGRNSAPFYNNSRRVSSSHSRLLPSEITDA